MAQGCSFFGDKCIACGHSGNIQIHHVCPVETYPELAFDPQNGVPLCGNCHAKVTGQEMEYADEFLELQQRALGVNPSPTYTIEELKGAAEADLSNAHAVFAFLNEVHNPKEAVDFFIKNRENIRKTSLILCEMSRRFYEVGRHSDAVEFADEALSLAREEGKAPELAELIAFWKVTSLNALEKTEEALEYLEALLGEFRDDADLHMLISRTIAFADKHIPEKPFPDLCLTHALRAIQLRPEDPKWLGWASEVCCRNGRLKEAMAFAKKEFACARDDEERLEHITNEMSYSRTKKNSCVRRRRLPFSEP